MGRLTINVAQEVAIEQTLCRGELQTRIATSGAGQFGRLAVGREELTGGDPSMARMVVRYDGLSAGVTVTLPAAADHRGRLLFIFNADAAETVTVLGSVLTTGELAAVVSDGTAWRLLITTGT